MQANSLSLDRAFASLDLGTALRGFNPLPAASRVWRSWAGTQWRLWQIRRDARRLQRALAPLDGATLRDLGLSHHQRDPSHDDRQGRWPHWQW